MTTSNEYARGGGGLAILVLLVAVGAARADVAGTYDGSLTIKKTGEIALVAGSLTEVGPTVAGTIAMNLADAAAGGVFNVTGQARGKRVSLAGVSTTGSQLRWKGRPAGNDLRGKAKLVGPAGRSKGTLVLTHRGAETPTSPTEACDNPFFTGQVMGLVLQPVCAACHVAGGAAQNANFRVTAGDPLATQQSVALGIDKAHPDESRILRKPLNLLPHGGGQQLALGSEQYQVLEQWVSLVSTGEQCDAQPDVPMVPLGPSELLVRASMDLRGTRPAPSELDSVEADDAAYAGLVDQYLHGFEFLERVKDAYDDALLVRREDFSDESREETRAIYGEALELIAYIVANDRPFTEIGTADYTVANPLFQRDVERMPYPMTPVSGPGWQPAYYLDGRPHAGLLSTSAFYQVWDTNGTNKNRRRANRWSIVFHCYNFLDTPVDVTRNVDNNDDDAVLNAVTTRPDCRGCHDRLDPLASFLFPTDNARLETDDGENFFSGDPDRWRYANRRPPAVYTAPGIDIRDMGRLLTQNAKFAECQTKRAFRMLFLRDPRTTTELHTASDIARAWVGEDGYDFRALVRRWMLSDAYRKRPQDHDPQWVRRVSPERLESMLADLTGFVWLRDPDDDQDDGNPDSDPPRFTPVSRLTNEERGFKIIFGGINGVSVSGRSFSLNASVVNVQRKVAALAADYVVRTDLAVPDGRRKLLNGVSGAEHPFADEGALRNHIVRLVRRLYGRRLVADAAQVDGWLELYRALYADQTQSGDDYGEVPGAQGERAWRGLLTAMLRSPQIVLY